MEEGLHAEEVDLAVEVTIEEGDTLLEVVTVEDIVVDPEDTHHIEIFQRCCWRMRVKNSGSNRQSSRVYWSETNDIQERSCGLKAQRLSHYVFLSWGCKGTGVTVL